ncbi:hypothetical protein [Streptomyces sp. V4I23]|uniref:hypothetical protein n=1 Tax=Streptomyces sp. V4I23 TaxID=3042282 RepID=UPI0027D88FCB|nr:hypothetical protein [Streptomyces sp. V4I23]
MYFESELAAALASDREVLATARRGFEQLFNFLVRQHGEQGADLAFFPPDHPGQGPVWGVRDFVASRPGLKKLMAAFTRAVHGSSPTALSRTLPGRIAPAGPVREQGYQEGVSGLVHDARGFRYVGGVGGPALGLLQAYQLMGADRAELTAFRKAVVAWAVWSDAQSLHETLRASHSLGLGDQEEHVALSRDGARLHLWADAHLAPPGVRGTRRLQAPHHRLYGSTYRFSVDDGDIIVPDTIQNELATALSGRPLPWSPSNRLQAAVEWLETYGDEAREALRALQPAHLTAMFLYSGPDHKLFKRHINGGRFGEAVGRWMLRSMIREFASFHEDLPLLLEHDEAFKQLVEDIDELESEPTDKFVLRVEKALNDITDRIGNQLPVHVAMAAEALELLPGVNSDVWFGDSMPGQIGEVRTDDPLITANTLFNPWFRSTSNDQQEAFDFMNKKDVSGGRRHHVLGHVLDSTAPIVAPFVRWPEEKEVQYGPGGAWQIVGREYPTNPETGKAYELLTLREMPPRPVHSSTPGSRRDGGGPSYPARAYWNAPGDASGNVPGDVVGGLAGLPSDSGVEGLQRWEVFSADGQRIGAALFSEYDWALREPVYARLGNVAEYREWSVGSAGVPVNSPRAMPASGAGTFYAAGHANSVDALLELVGDGVSHLMVVACGAEGNGAAASWRRLQPYADARGIPVSRPTGKVAVVPGEGGAGVPVVHLVEDGQGRPTRWVTVRPGGGFDLSMLMPAEPARRSWSVPGWRPAGAVEGVRFGVLYAHPEWQQLSKRFEEGLAAGVAFSSQGADGSIQDAFGRLWNLLVERHGGSGAFSAFFPGEEYRGPMEAEEFVGNVAAGRRGVLAMMDAFARAVFEGPSAVTLVGTLPARIDVPGVPQGAALRARGKHGPDGFRHVGGTDGPARTLLQAYRLLGANREELQRFRDRGVIPWAILTNRQSLHEALRDSHALGLGDQAEWTALSRDAARLHLWARDHYAPREDPVETASQKSVFTRPEAPHHQLYARQHQYEDLLVERVPEDLQRGLDEALAGQPATMPNTKSARAFLDRHGKEGVKALRSLRPAHLTALYLYSRSGIYEMMQSYARTSRLGDAVARWTLGTRLLKRIVPNSLEGLEHITLDKNPNFLRLVEAVENAPEGSDPGSDPVVRRALRDLTGELLVELRMHIDMVAEALELLPPETDDAWYGGWLPQQSDGTSEDMPLLSQEVLFSPGARSTSRDRTTAVTFVKFRGVRNMPPRPDPAYYNAADVTPHERILPGARHHSSLAVPVAGAAHSAEASLLLEWSGSGSVRFSGSELGLAEVVGVGDRLVEALAHALRHGAPQLLTGDTAVDGPGLDLTGPSGLSAEALYRWVAGEVTEDDVPSGAELMAAGQRVSLAELKAVGVVPTVSVRTQAELQGGVVSVGEAGLTGVQQLRLVLGRGGERPGAVGEVVADVLGRVHGFQVVLAERGTSTEVRRLGATTTLPESPSVLLVREDGHYLAAVPARCSERSGPTPGGPADPAAPGGDPEAPGALREEPSVPLGARGMHAGADPAQGRPGTDLGRGLAVYTDAAFRHDVLRRLNGLPKDAPHHLVASERLAALRATVRDARISEQWLRDLADRLGSRRAGRGEPAAFEHDAPVTVLAALRYQREAERFEARLGRYAAAHEIVGRQLETLVRALWERVTAAEYRADPARSDHWRLLGTTDAGVDGAVGDSWSALEKVVESGNVRERFALFYTARENKLLEMLLGPAPYPAALVAERKDRVERTKEERERNRRWAYGTAVGIGPDDVQPPLSDGERRLTGGSTDSWVAGADLYEVVLSSPLQKDAFRTGALVTSGTSGTTYSLMRFALKMRDQWGVDVDLAALRLLMIGGMVPARHHTVHELMRGAQMVFEEIAAEGAAVPEELNYLDGWARYWRIAPLSERELRGLSPDGRLPDERALDLLPSRRTEEDGPVVSATDGTDRFPEESDAIGAVLDWIFDLTPMETAEVLAGLADEHAPVGVAGIDRAGPKWRSELVLGEILDKEGRPTGLVSYSHEEMPERVPALRQLPYLTQYTEWHRDHEGRRVSVQRDLPYPGGGRTFFWVSHGTLGSVIGVTQDGGTRKVDTIGLVELIWPYLEGFTDITVLSCRSAPAPDPTTTAAVARRIEALTKLAAHVVEWEAAVTPSSGAEPVRLHLYEKPDGSAAGFSSAYPHGRAQNTAASRVQGTVSWPVYPDIRYRNAGTPHLGTGPDTRTPPGRSTPMSKGTRLMTRTPTRSVRMIRPISICG